MPLLTMLALVTEAYGGLSGMAQYNRDFLEACAATDFFESINILPRSASQAIAALPTGLSQRAGLNSTAAFSAHALGQAVSMRPDVVFCGHLTMAPLARLATQISRARLVTQVHGTEIWKRPSRSQRKALQASDLVVCASRDTRARTRAEVFLPEERTPVVPNMAGAAFTPGDRTEFRSRHGIDRDAFVLLTVAPLDRREHTKGHERVIEALPRLKDHLGRPVRYVIAGDGDDRQRLEGLVACRKLTADVRFLGYVPRSDLPSLYRCADLFVLPSEGEGFGTVFLEALACGTPAIGVRLGGSSDALADGELGRCVEAGAFVEQLLAASTATHPAPEAISTDVQARFGHDAFGARVRELCKRLLNDPPTPAGQFG